MFANKKGFTLIELMIVIVVIAILAAISIVAYNGIQTRAYDAQMRSDLSGAAKSLYIYYITDDAYPNSSATGAKVEAKFSFSPVGNNVILCANNADSDGGFAIIARNPKGAKAWYKYESTTGQTTTVSPATSGAADLCATSVHPALLWGSFWVTGG